MNLRAASLIILSLTGSAYSADKITYDDHIFPIFESKCLNCHNPDKKKGDLDLSTYIGTMAGSSGGKVALAGDGGSSKLFTVSAHTEEPVMPPEGEKIAKKDADLIRAWIDGGLLENKGSKAKKKQKPAFSLAAVPTGKKPEGPPPMPDEVLLEPVVTPGRATVVADMESSPWAPLLAVTAPRQVLLYHTDTLELVGVLPFPKGNPETLSFHPSGNYLIAGGGIGGKSGSTVTWDVTTGKVLMTMGREFDSVLATDLRADLGGIALGGPSRLIKLWDTAADEQIKSIKKHTDWVTALAYSPDGVLLATGDRNNGIQIWEAFSGNEFHSLRGHQKSITDLKWRADSNLVASSSEDGTIRFWDMNRGKEIKKASAGPGVVALDYARNGKLISAGRDKRVKLWKADLNLEKQSQPFAEMVTEVAFSHNAARFFTADWNGRIEVWNTADFKKVGELSAAPPAIASRIATLNREKSEFLKKIEGLKQKNEAAKAEHQKSIGAIQNVEASIAKLRKEINDLKVAGNTLNNEIRKLEQQAQEKIKQRDQLPPEDPGIEKFNQEHQALVTQRDEKRKLVQGKQNQATQKKNHIPNLQKQIPNLRKVLAEKDKLSKAAQAELDEAVSQLPAFDQKIKKWKAATILTELIKARRELEELNLQKSEDPSLAGKAAEAEKRVNELKNRYQAAK